MGDHIIFVLDGIYIFIQKCKCTSYSEHKYRNLKRPIIAVCTDGYIVDIWEPHPGNKN